MAESTIICPQCETENPPGQEKCTFCGFFLGDSTGAMHGKTRIRAPQDLSSLQEGDLIAGRYRVKRHLGSGGMGSVYQVADEKLEQKEVALKVINPSIVDAPEVRQRFVREVLASQELAHENIIRVFHLDDADGVPFFTMEYLAGRSLREVMAGRFEKGGAFSLQEACAVLLPVLSALSNAHGHGIIHRDLKPENIVVIGDLPDARIKVLDFGLARIMSPSRLTSSAEAMGTVGYMSPEQIKGEKADEQSDVFSAGAILYELLTGELPSFGSRLPSEISSGLPAEVDFILKRALNPDKNGRYNNPLDMHSALGRAVSQEIRQKQDEDDRPSCPTDKQSRKGTGRYMTAGWIAAAAAVVILLSGGWWWYGKLQPDETWDTVTGCPAPEIQKQHWAEIRDAEGTAPFENYLERCPGGEFAAEARRKLGERYLSRAEDALARKRPEDAGKYLEEISASFLSESDQKRYEKLVAGLETGSSSDQSSESRQEKLLALNLMEKTGEIQEPEKQKRYSASFQIVPPDAALELEGRPVSLNENGHAKVEELKDRKYSFSVSADGHESHMGVFNPASNRVVHVELETEDAFYKTKAEFFEKVQEISGEQEFDIDLWTEKEEYRIGQEIVFYFRSERDCHLNLVDINSRGEISLIFPNRYHRDNFVEGGRTYKIPGPGYGFSFEVEPPAGTERVYAVASTSRLDIFQTDFDREFFTSLSRQSADQKKVRGIGVKMEGIKLDAAEQLVFEVKP